MLMSSWFVAGFPTLVWLSDDGAMLVEACQAWAWNWLWLPKISNKSEKQKKTKKGPIKTKTGLCTGAHAVTSVVKISKIICMACQIESLWKDASM